MAIADELVKLAELRANGSLTEQEYALAKERLLKSEPLQFAEPFASGLSKFRRSRNDKWFGGVCGGFARSVGTEAWIWRLLFALLFICAGAGLLLYVVMWIFVPSE